MSSRSLFDPPSLTTAIEIAAHRVSAVRVGEQDGRTAVLAHASTGLPEGAVVPSLTSANLADRDAVIAAIGRVLGDLGGRTTRAGLVVPDPVAKVSLIRFDKVPARSDDLEQLVRWQVRKTAPFQIEEAQVAFSKGATGPDGGVEFIVAIARRSVVEEYESACAAAGVHAGLVDLATFNILNAVQAAGPPGQDWLLVAVTATYTTIAILRRGDLIFFRTRPEGEGSLADLVHQTAMYYEDRLGGDGFSRVLLSGDGTTSSEVEAAQVARELEARLGVKVEAVDPRPAAGLTDRIVADPALLDRLAPLVGLLVRARAA
jgi:Tfp pilus assembly PilM family ATPase